jgi:hypothetical protein
MIASEGVFYGAIIPAPKFKNYYSIMWGGMYSGFDDHINLFLDIANGTGVS